MLFIIEGPDGAGKTNLIGKILARYPDIEVGPRFATSEGGPRVGVDELVDKDMARVRDILNPILYDRHALISELIYGPILRGRLPGRYNNPEWLRRRVSELADRAMVVWCLPPLRNVLRAVNSGSAPQLKGVDKHIESLYAGYQALRAVWWPGRAITYDYTTDLYAIEVLRVVGLYKEGNG